VTRPFSIVCLSSQEWSTDLPTNRQQIMLRASRRGHEILFIETGHFTGRHLWRLLGAGSRRSLARRLFATESVAPGIRVRKSLNLLPWGQKYRLANRLNSLVTAQLVRIVARSLPEPRVLWIYDPCAAHVAGSCGEALAAYDCVDDYVEQAGPDRQRRALVAAGDRRAAHVAKLVFATTSPLYERLSRVNTRTHLVPNAGDYDHFRPAADPSFAAPEVRDLARPTLGFAGNFLASKVDFELLEAVARARPEWTLLLIGPARSETEEKLQRLGRLPNVVWLGPKPYEELPRYVAGFDVGLIPYTTNAYTQSCFPLKVYEYLAAGKPIVASGLPELAGMEPDVALVEGKDELIGAVDAALGRVSSADRERRIALAARNTWETRTERLLEFVSSELSV
jgi:glycosyltransferase involved in cell wall biosynthesis